MSYSRKNVELVNREFEQRRADNKATQQKNLKKAYSLCPELMSVDNELSRVGMEIFALAMKGKEYFDANIGALQEKNENLENLQKLVFEKLQNLGFELEEREFIPHITIARKFRPEENFSPAETEKRLPKKPVHAGRISLMKSERVEDVLRYTEIFSKKLF